MHTLTHTFTHIDDGSVYMWGRNDTGQVSLRMCSVLVRVLVYLCFFTRVSVRVVMAEYGVCVRTCVSSVCVYQI